MKAHLDDLSMEDPWLEKALWGDDTEDDFFDDDTEDIFASLIPVNDHQIACAGIELIDLLNYSEEVDEADESYFTRLGLTYKWVEDDFCPEEKLRVFAELSDEAYYLLTFTDETDLTDFSMLNLLSIEEIPEQTYHDFAAAAGATPCDGNCDACNQACIGKQPIE